MEAQPETENGHEKEMTFMEHLEELRDRLLYCIYAIVPAVIVSFSFAPNLLGFVTYHARSLVPSAKHAASPIELNFSPLVGPFLTFRSQEHITMLQSLSPTETIMAYMKIAFVAAIFIVFPFIMYQVWRFVEPGLKKNEKKFLGPFLLSSWVFFIVGGLFAYYIMLQLAVPILAQFGEGITVNAWSLSNYVSFVLRMTLVFGIVFELPVVIALLSMLGIVTPEFLRKNRPYAIVIIAISAAFLTPPDPFTMILLGLPLLMLYELSVFVSAFFQREPEEPSDLTPAA